MSPAPESPLPPSGAAAEEARFGLRQVDLRMLRVPAEILALVPAEFALQYRLLALGWTEAGSLRVAVADPLATEGVDVLALLLGCAVESVLAAPADLGEALRRSYVTGYTFSSHPKS